MTISKLARKIVQKLTPYLSARRIGGRGNVWINANESPFDNLYQIEVSSLNRYTECQPKTLIQAYADYANVNTNQVLVSRGADEGIELLIRTFCESKQDSILFCPPTYGMYAVSAEAFEVECKTVPLKADWQLDLSEIEKQLDKVKIVFICNPNNPTSNLIDSSSLLALLQLTQNRALVVVDEAYIEFAPEFSSVTLLKSYANLVILRTLSKAFALAGLRCGFTLANSDVIQLMLKVIAPYPISSPTASIACQALSKQGITQMNQQVAIVNENKAWFCNQLSQLKEVSVYSAFGNFALITFPNAEQLFEALYQQGIVARRTPIKNSIRFSIGTKQECQKIANFITSYYLNPSNIQANIKEPLILNDQC